ncbi:TonB-dependent receptor domain-containing protein [Cellulophaga sp. Hel_I_12]|uniref:TonB-dependent receptor n=1 Tax=Cellulophaga sp. Hel_I_12 TaxID=1249972 RepID=UPI000647B9A6|nr:TonB-dependent receptor [Cellulophaga sp. Hel_I_12]
MKKILYFSFLLLGVFGFSQTTVKGTVVDQNSQPIPGSNVVIQGKSVGTVTDFDGNFVLVTSEVPPFKLIITSIGYSEASVDVTTNNQVVSVILNESQTLLDEIVISASRTPERIFESPVSVERFGLKEIKNTSSESFYSGLQNLKGVDVNTNSLTFQSVNTRGFATFANNRFLQLVDGMDNSAPGLNFVLGNLVGMSELEVQSVEILPGASSALYGAGAFNGVLFMTSKNPFDYQGISAYYKTGYTSQEAAGNNAYYDFGIRAAHAFSDKFAIKANFSYLQGEDWHANSIQDLARPGATRENPAFDGLNVYGDEVSTTLNFDDLAVPDGPNGQVNSLPSGTLGSALVSRTGYDELDLANYEAQSVKTDFSVHYKPFADDFEILYNGRVGRGNTIYQGTNRYSIKNFIMQQHKFEIRNNNFFLRGYLTVENSGDSYDTRFAAINVNRSWKQDAPDPNNAATPSWFGDYARTFIGARLGVGTGVQLDETTAHALARQAADRGRLLPGTPEFENAFNSVITNGNLDQGGARFVDNTKLRHADGNYNFTHLTKDFADIQVGGSFREYELNSNGTIFTDKDGPITYSEFGAYMQVQKKLIDDRLKLTGSIRYDKNEFFDGFLSPRLSGVMTLGEKKNHNVRLSVQQGFRNPTTQDLFIGLNAGRAILVGSAPTNLDRDVRVLNNNPQGNAQAIGQGTTSTLTGRNAYENAWSLSSVTAFRESAALPLQERLALLESVNTDFVQPEEITAYELGYRAQLGKVSIDLSGYYNSYANFISNTTVVAPFYGDAELQEVIPGTSTPVAIAALSNTDVQAYQTYTNAEADINSYGATIGVDAKVLGNFDLGASYTYAEFDFDQAAFPDFRPSFNTPKHKVRASFGNTEVFKNVGFNINYRWTDTYFWQATFADGDVPAFTVLDAQVNFSVPSMKSLFKIGGSNILNQEYVTAIGTGNIGSIYYISWGINL